MLKHVKVMSKLSTATPSPALVDAYQREIALAYGVPWLSADEPMTNTDSTAQEVKVSHTFTRSKYLLNIDHILIRMVTQ